MKSSSRYGSASADEALMHYSEEHAHIEQEQRLVWFCSLLSYAGPPCNIKGRPGV